MKTITLTDEEYAFLKEAKHILNTQDNRCTRDPFFVIMDWKDVPVPDGEGEKVKWYTHDGDCIAESEEELFDYLWENYDDFEEAMREGLDEDDPSDKESLKGLFVDNFYTYTGRIEDVMNEFHKVDVSSNSFIDNKCFSLFESDVDAYLKHKRHHFSPEASTYVCYGGNADKMTELRNFLMNVKLED